MALPDVDRHRVLAVAEQLPRREAHGVDHLRLTIHAARPVIGNNTPVVAGFLGDETVSIIGVESMRTVCRAIVLIALSITLPSGFSAMLAADELPKVPKGLDPPPIPADNPMTAAPSVCERIRSGLT